MGVSRHTDDAFMPAAHDCAYCRTTRRPWRCVILDLSNSSTIDSTALQALNDARMFLASKSVNIRFIVAHANRHATATLSEQPHDIACA